MNIALFVVLGGDLVRSTEHIGIGYLAAYLREHNHQVQIIEVEESKLYDESVYIPLLKNYGIAGFTTTCVTMKNIAVITQIIKKRYPTIRVVYGGHMATFSGRELMQSDPNIDYVIFGEGEYTLLDLAQTLEVNGDIGAVAGLGYRKNGQIVVNPGRSLIENLDVLPFPARDQFEQHNMKFQYLRISSSRGCLGNCGFCSAFAGRSQKGPRWRGRSVQNVVDEIEYLVRHYNFHTFDFVDSTFEDPGPQGKQRIREIAVEILARNLTVFYNCCFRAENWSLADSDLLQLLVQSGLEKINIGFESGNDRGLRILNKRATMEDNRRVLDLMQRFPEVYVTFGFIMLHPYSQKQDLADNAAFLHSSGIGQVIRHYCWQLEVYPGTAMEHNLKRDHLLKKEYSYEDGMYKYLFCNQEMDRYAKRFSSLLTLKSVWDYEIFDILIHTFITRLLRRYGSEPFAEEIRCFSNYVQESRRKTADFNYSFFLQLLETGDSYDLNSESQRLDRYILNEMDQIRSQQYMLGMRLRRQGIDMNIQ